MLSNYRLSNILLLLCNCVVIVMYILYNTYIYKGVIFNYIMKINSYNDLGDMKMITLNDMLKVVNKSIDRIWYSENGVIVIEFDKEDLHN